MRALVFLLMLPFIMSSAAAEKSYLWEVYAGNSNIIEYESYIKKNNPFYADEISADGLWRHPMEFTLLRHAVLKSNCNADVKFMPYHIDVSHIRMIEEVESGRVIALPSAVFDNDPRVLESFYLSAPILEAKDFYVGLYTHEDRRDILKLNNLDTLRSLRYSVGETWIIDRKVLKDLGFRSVPSESWSTILNMVVHNRADVVLQPFAPTEDMSFFDTGSGLTFVPVPNIKVNFSAGRRYAVSKKHPEGKKMLECLNQGLEKLRENGTINQYLIQSGVLDPRIYDFEVLSSD